MVWRVLGVVVVLAAVGAGLGFGAGAITAGSPDRIASTEPVPASSPSVPVESEAPYSPDVDYPALGTGLRYATQVVGQGDFAWGYVAPRRWQPTVRGPSEVGWAPLTAPDGTYGMRVKIVNERKTPEAMVEGKIQDLAAAEQDVDVLGRTTDALAITYRTDGNRLRYNTFRWFTPGGGVPDAQFEVSVNGRARDLDGLDDLLDQISASVRPDPPQAGP